ncbi:glycosyl hydrolase 115 family protein, partial [Anaerosporobacter sp.]|uniref:glycosyl hydrolase 115 family protein n=1 Tax=Anaerosporobacter sp. TaxID=1872529 RepID=UPI00286EB743
MSLIINRNLKIIALIESESVNHAISNLQRDIVKSCEETQEEGIELHLMKKEMKDESFSLQVDAGKLFLYAADSLGFIYGIYEISRSILGIMNFWFWNDQQIVMKQGYEVAEDFSFTSKPYPVRFRGWFVNDEVLLHTWSVDREKDKPWEMVFEALLRCEGNMIIPGTDRNSEHYRKIASRMGLYITHHHAEPLGAEMFARAYPDLNPSYVEHSDKF